MPKNDKNVNAHNVTPEAVTVESSEAPGSPRLSRRLGTGALVGISAAGAALIAGVFGGGIALGVGISHESHDGMGRNASEASGQREGDRIQGDRMQGGPVTGGPMNGGPGQSPDNDGPMMGGLPPLPAMPGAPNAPTTVPTPTN